MKTQKQTLIFLKPFTIKNPTLDEQNEFILLEIVNEVECAQLGTIYNNDKLYGKGLYEFINKEARRLKPEWIVAEGESATVALAIKKQKKILITLLQVLL